MNGGFWSLLYLALEGIAAISALHAVWYVRTSQAAVAWVVGLLVFPLISVPLYWVFGRYRFYGYREALRDVGQIHKRSVGAINRELRTRRNSQTTRLLTPLEQVADVLDTPLCSGNQFELLIDGKDFYTALQEQIAAAESYIYLEFYIIRADATGSQLADALIAKAQQGVIVRMLYDELGSIRLTRAFVRKLLAAGVDVRAFNTRQGISNRFQINFRNHRKLVVIDGQTAIVGGFNVGDEYLGQAWWIEGWRDTAVAMRGPIVRKVQAVFAGDYYWSARRDLAEANWEHEPTNADLDETGLAAVCATGPADERPLATMMFAAAANSARQRLWISTPYLVPDETLKVVLTMARARGVDVRILAPAVADVWPVYLAGLHYERELLEAGIHIMRYTQHVMMHQKCVLVDEQLVLIGSTNLDIRSLHLNFELMIAISDTLLVRHMIAVLEADFARADSIRLSDPPRHPWQTAAGRVIARLFSPIL
jgi:cardiolipin synthase A/B